MNEIYSKYKIELEKNKKLQSSNKILLQNETKITQETSIEDLESNYNFLIKDNKATSDIFFYKKNIFENIVNFCHKYDKQISEMIKSYNFQELKLDHLNHSKKERLIFNNKDIYFDLAEFSGEYGLKECNLFYS